MRNEPQVRINTSGKEPFVALFLVNSHFLLPTTKASEGSFVLYLLTRPEAEPGGGGAGEGRPAAAGAAGEFPEAALAGLMEITIAQHRSPHVACLPINCSPSSPLGESEIRH